MKNIFTIAYSEEEANVIGHFIMSKGYEGVQNDSYRYCREKILWTFKQAKKHHIDFIYVGVNSYQLVISRTKRGLRRKDLNILRKNECFISC